MIKMLALSKSTSEHLNETLYRPAVVYAVHSGITAAMNFFLTVFFKEDLGFSGAQIGLLYSIHAITGMLAIFPAGMGNDRFSSRGLVIVGLFFQAVTMVIMGFTISFPAYCVLFLVWAITTWTFKLSLDVYFLKNVNGFDTGNRIGIFQAFRYFGLTVGTIVTGYFIVRFNFTWTLLIVAGVCLMLIIPSLSLAQTSVKKVRASDYRADFSNPRASLFALWMLLFATHWGAEQTCYSLFLRETFALSVSGLGWYFSAEYMAIVLILLITGDLIGKKKYAIKIAVLSLLASGIGHIGMVFPPIGVSVAFRILHGFGDGGMILVMYYGISKLFSVEHMGGNTGIINMANMIGYILSSMVYGLLGERYGYAHPLWISGITIILLVIPILIMNHRRSQ